MSKMLSKVALERIPSLTFYKDALTLSKRGDPVPQLTCVGKACRLYEPDVVRCTNAGGHGTEVDWKCEADLPEALRFGRVEVSCEGWSGPGDPYVLKGSCGLEYRLVQIPDALRRPDEHHRHHSRILNWIAAARENPSAAVFTIVWTACLLLILYSFLKSCFTSRTGSSSSSGSRPRPPDTGPGSGWFGSNGDHSPGTHDAPPPYTKYPTGSTPGVNPMPGFWTGAALGGLGTYLFNRGQRERVQPRPSAYDWEHDRLFRASPSAAFEQPPRESGGGFGRRAAFTSDDRGEGSSNLGSMRRSTGLGGSNVR
ncbi:uncharacterized protein C8Q71DRAFT_807720 [Rhodofomes roseus]|uniref:Store-operated calcium entry-associated regulatory factor n=1 Tax=Rhodofomes roseus TaxID=34475 RepID=A0ABQ8KKK5_9APHY|nr:uncharacterized protein C8Q71DRAFT_807720 [Rhodofomes roseus]KAH9838682.1 hypothetical protein C8Q71DRAFT_807720 [Rhodofomes roseus]